MPSIETRFQSPHEASIERGASSLRNRNEVYEMTRGHISSGLPLFIVVDEPGMTLIPGEDAKTSQGTCTWYSLKDGRINPNIRLRFPENVKPPLTPDMGTIFVGKGEFDEQAYSGFTVVEVVSK